ncbi:MAG TPA: calcium/sodium antiporter, partial [Sulfurimonas sp. UBA12504]
LAMAYRFKSKKEGVINRVMGSFLILCYIAYNSYLAVNPGNI